MLCVNPTNYHFKTFDVPKKTSNETIISQNADSKSIDKTLLALAAIGLATLTSCSNDNCIYPEEHFFMEEKTDSITPLNTQKIHQNVSEQADDILKSLGLIDDTSSVNNIKTICKKDNQGIIHWMKKTNITNDIIYGKGMSILSDSSAGEIYTFTARNSGNGGLLITKTFDDGSKQKLNYVKNKDNSITEYEVLDKSFELEKSVYKKRDDGSIERIFADGSTIIYNDIENNAPYPTPITFNTAVADTEYVNY